MATCNAALRPVATCNAALPHAATCDAALQRVATCNAALQHVATRGVARDNAAAGVPLLCRDGAARVVARAAVRAQDALLAGMLLTVLARGCVCVCARACVYVCLCLRALACVCLCARARSCPCVCARPSCMHALAREPRRSRGQNAKCASLPPTEMIDIAEHILMRDVLQVPALRASRPLHA